MMVAFSIAAAREQQAMAGHPFHAWTLPDGKPWTEFYRRDAGYVLRFPNLSDFQVSADGLHVGCYPVPLVPEATLQHLYLNQVLPLVLSRCGKLVFHASAVEVMGSAIAFVAESGRGKSTLAASFALGGHRFLTDDGLIVEEKVGGFDVLPSHPSIRLWEDSEEALMPTGARIAPPVHYTSKARFLAGDELAFCDQPRPLRRAYFLGDGTVSMPTIEPLTAAQALVEWVKNSFLLDVEEKSRLASHFRQVASLAQRSIHYRLDFPRQFADLATLRQAIVEHMRVGDDAP